MQCCNKISFKRCSYYLENKDFIEEKFYRNLLAQIEKKISEILGAGLFQLCYSIQG